MKTSMVKMLDGRSDENLSSPQDQVLSDFSSFYQEYHQVVRAVVFRMGIENDLDDVVQAVFIKAWRKIGQFNGKSSLKTWVVRIALNSSHDHLRHLKRWSFFGRDEDKNNLASMPSSPETKDVVQKVLSRLSADHRSVLVLHLQQGFSQEEVAEVMQKPIGTVKSKLHRARQAFKKEYEKLGGSREK